MKLKDSAALASSLNIIESNLSQLNKGSNNMNLNIAIQSGTNINAPDWYLLVKLSLLKMIESLETRASDEAFIPQLLKLDSEISKLKSIRPDSADINAMQLYQAATSEIIPTKNRLIIALAFIGSFILSILLVFLMNAFKEEDVTSIQKGK